MQLNTFLYLFQYLKRLKVSPLKVVLLTITRLLKLSLIFFPLISFAKMNNSDIFINSTEEKYFNDEKTPSAFIVFEKEITEIEDYLNSFETLQADFKQSNTQGNIRYGKIYISKPEKIRCDYLPPSPVVLIIKENKILFYDIKLDEISYTSSDINSLKLLALENFRFQDVDLVEVEKGSDFISFSIREKIKKSDQILLVTMNFSYPDIELNHINILSEDNNINLILTNVQYDQIFGKELFSFSRDILRKNKP